MYIILLSGWSGSGKDTTATILEEQTDFQRVAFANELKMIVAQEFKIPLVWTQTQEGKQRLAPNGKTVRDLLIQRGQEIRKEKEDPGFFAGCVAKTIREAATYKRGFIVTDWRLLVELERLAAEFPKAHLLCVRIRRTGQMESPVKDDLTEHELDDYPFDIEITNRGTSIHDLTQELLTQFAAYNIIQERTDSGAE